jgi:lipopolysaccharide biosynthesis regulator YciM
MISELKIKNMFNEILEDLDHIYNKLNLLLDDLDNIIYKVVNSPIEDSEKQEIKKDLDYLYSELESLMNEVKNYCIGDCYFCYKNCDIDCSDCNTCPSLSVCIDKGKIEFLRRI